MGDLFFNKVIPVIDRAHGASTAEWTETIDAVIARVIRPPIHPGSRKSYNPRRFESIQTISCSTFERR